MVPLEEKERGGGRMRECEQKKRARSVVTPDDNLSAYSDSLRVSGNSSSPPARVRARAFPSRRVSCAPIEDNNRPICSILHFSFLLELFFLFFLLLFLLLWREGGGRHRCALLKAFRIHDSQKLDWNCSNRSPVSSFARIFSRLCIITYSVLYSFIHFRLIPFVDLLFSSPASIDRSLGLETDI